MKTTKEWRYFDKKLFKEFRSSDIVHGVQKFRSSDITLEAQECVTNKAYLFELLTLSV